MTGPKGRIERRRRHRVIVVAAVDGSEHTPKVVEAATEFAGNGEIHIVYVSLPAVYPGPESEMAPVVSMTDIEAIRKAESEAVWARVGPIPDNAVTKTLSGSPAAMIQQYAKEVDADLIIVGSRGRGAIASLFLGSVSHGVVHGADRNVLIVR